MNQESRTVKTTENACEIIMALKRLNGAGVTDLAEELDYAQGAVHSQLQTLCENGFVVQDGKKYRLSFKFLDIAQQIVSRFEDFDLIRSEINSLADETGEVAHFGTNENGEVVYLHRSRGDNAVKTGSFMGKREPLHSTAMGKAILSTKSDEKIKNIINEYGLPELTDKTITTRDKFSECLEQIQERGYAVDDEENARGLRCVAVPVMASKSENLGAVGISGPASRMTKERYESEIIDRIQRSANLIEVNYKFS